jgi:hypothetical protein
MVKLSTGREVEVKSWTLEQRVEIDDLMTEYYYRLGIDLTNSKQLTNAPFSFSVALKGIKFMSTVPENINNVEIIDWFNLIYEASHISELDKKK